MPGTGGQRRAWVGAGEVGRRSSGERTETGGPPTLRRPPRVVGWIWSEEEGDASRGGWGVGG
jgi:hypothetical protein